MKKPFEINEARYSSFNKFLRVTAYINRFIYCIKNERKIENELTVNETNRAELIWFKHIEGKHHLSNKQQLSKNRNRVNSTEKYTNMELLYYMTDLSVLTYRKMQNCQFFYQGKKISQNC